MPAQYLESAARAIFHASWQAAILAVIVLATCRAIPRLPAATRSWLWLIVLLRLVVPLTPQSSWSLFNLANVSRTTVNSESLAGDVAGNRSATTSAQMVHGADDRGIATPTFAIVTSSPGKLAHESANDQGSADAASIVPTLMRGAVCMWALGLVALLARDLRSWISLRRLLRASRVVEEEWPLAVLEECRLEAGIRRFVELVVTEKKVAPALAGVVFPRIVLSEETLAAVSPAELAWLFRHELAHVRRWDLAVQRLWSCACALHWFNPLVWWAASRARLEAELACDESVIREAKPHDQLAYGEALLKVAELLTESKPLPAAVGLSLREPVLSRRIYKIASRIKRSRVWAMVGGTLVVMIASIGLTDAVESAGKGHHAESPTASPKQLATNSTSHTGQPRFRMHGPYTVETELQRMLAPLGTNLYLYVDITDILKSDRISLEEPDLRALSTALMPYQKSHPRLHITLCCAQFDEPITLSKRDQNKLLHDALAGLTQKLGLRSVTVNDMPMTDEKTLSALFASSSSHVASLNHDEPSSEKDHVHVFPVRTELSRVMTSNADCAVFIEFPRRGDPDVLPDVARNAVFDLVKPLKLSRRQKIAFFVQFNRHVSLKYYPHAHAGLTGIAKKLGFASSTLTWDRDLAFMGLSRSP